jgi:flagellar basal-body rod modification protein FlgD
MSFVGKTVKASGSMFELVSGETCEIQFELGEDADAVYVSIYNATGEIVKKIEMDQMTAGEQAVVWDGKDENGNAVPAGIHSFSVQAYNTDGASMDSAAYIEKLITGVSYHSSKTYLLADDIEIPYSAVIEVKEPEKK